MSKRPHDYDSGRSERRRSGDLEPPPDLYSIFQGQVASVQQYGVFVKIPGSRRQGLVHKSQMSRTRVEDPSEMISVGELVYYKVISHGEDGSKIGLSMKVVNQTTGQDLDPNNVELSMDENKKKSGFQREIQKIELGAFLDTICRKCGAKGHFAQDCFHVEGGKAYELVPDLDEMASIAQSEQPGSSSPKKKKKERKKHKKEKSKHKKEKKQKKKKWRSSGNRSSDSSAASSDSEANTPKHKHRKTSQAKSHGHHKYSPDVH